MWPVLLDLQSGPVFYWLSWDKEKMNRVIDIHNHIVFGVDDGAQTLEMSLSMAQQAANRGITDIIATPHELEQHQIEKSGLRQQKIISNFKRLQVEIIKNNIPVTIYLGSELYFTPLVKYATEIPYFTYLNNKKYTLIEFSLNWPPQGYKELFYDIMNQGCTPILAHPGRYVYFWEIVDEVLDLIKMGSLLQINSGSLLGYNGIRSQYISELLLRKGLVHFIASDAHKTSEAVSFTLTKAVDYFQHKYPKLPFEDYIYNNPQKVLEGIPIEPNDEPCFKFNVLKEKKRFKRKMFIYSIFHNDNKKKFGKRRIYF